MKLLTFVIIMHTYAMMFSQSDSLLKLYNQQTGLKKVITGLQLCEHLEENPEKYLLISKELLKIIQKTDKASLYHAKVLKSVSDAYYYSDSLNSSIDYLLKAIAIAKKISPQPLDFLGETYNDLGLNYLDSGDRTKAYDFLLKANNYLIKSKNLIIKADAKSNLASFYHSVGQFDNATKLFIEVYNLDKQSGNKNKQSSSLNSIGRVYVDWGKYDAGLKYYFQSLALLDTVKEMSSYAIRCNNIGMVYQLKHDHRNAIIWIGKALNIELKEGIKPKLAIRYFNLANSYSALKKFEKAQNYYNESEKIFTNLGMDKELSKVYAGIGQLMIQKGKRNIAYEYLKKSLDKARISGTLPEKLNIYKLMHDYFKSGNQYHEALNYFELYINAKDSIFNLNASKQVDELEIQYQTAQKELEINRLESENKIKQKELKFRKRERNIATLGFILICIFSVVLYRLFRLVKKQKAVLADQNTQLDKLNNIQNQIFSIISHDFRSLTASYKSSAKIIEHYLQKGQPEKLIPIAGEISKNSNTLSSMLENLLQWALIRKKGIEPDKKLMNLNIEIQEIIDILNDTIKSKNNKIKTNIKAEYVYADPQSVRIILINLLSNANKFTDNGEITVESDSKENMTVLRIIDTGTGMTNETLNKLFDFGKEKIKKGTAGEKGTGLGLMLVKEHVESNNGIIEVASELGKGSSFCVILPTYES